MGIFAPTAERRMIMYKYFVSYFGIKKGLFNTTKTLGNAFFETNQPLNDAVIREFERQKAEKTKAKNVVVISIHKL